MGRARIDGAETTKLLQAAQAANVDATHITVISQLEGPPGRLTSRTCSPQGLPLAPQQGHVTINEADLIATDKPFPILKRIGIAREKQNWPRDFDHVGPAHQLTRDKKAFFEQVDNETLDRFETVFKKLAARTCRQHETSGSA